MEPFIGQIIMFGGTFAPRGWALCDGQLLPIASYSALFSILGTTYGGDGRTTFGLPELRGRVSMHAGNGPGLSQRRLGQRSGAETTTLNVTNLPSHSHTITNDLKVGATTTNASEDDPSGHLLGGGVDAYSSGAANATMAAGSVGGTITAANTGGNQASNNVQPFLVVNYIIALQGVYPSRN